MDRPSPEALFLPPQDAAALYRGHVIHARMKPKPHRFRYSVFMLLVDIGALPEARKLSWLFSVNRWNLLSFYQKDHASGDTSVSLLDQASRLLETAGLARHPARILLLCYPRVLGFTFNPLSVYFAYDEADRLIGLIYEVRNTFGEMHTYVAPLKPDEMTEAGVRQERDKLFYVSPFMDMPMRYHFRVRPPQDDVSLRILETDAQGPILSACTYGRHKALTSASILAAFLSIPLMTLKVVLGIHYEALKLWLKGIRFHARPEAPPLHSVDGAFVPASPAKENRT